MVGRAQFPIGMQGCSCQLFLIWRERIRWEDDINCCGARWRTVSQRKGVVWLFLLAVFYLLGGKGMECRCAHSVTAITNEKFHTTWKTLG